jgi:molybdopterin biosynthesis enzyme
VVGRIGAAAEIDVDEHPSRIARGDAARVMTLAPLPDIVLVDAFRIPIC